MRQIPDIRKYSTAPEREQIVADYQRSQLTQREFARQSGIGLSTLQRWVQQAAKPRPPANPAAFVPVANLLAQNNARGFYRLLLPDGVIVEVPSGFGAHELQELLAMLKAL